MEKTYNRKLEILSPAGSAESFYADINAGADAIYLGLTSFNARMKAENFTTENIREFVRYAHLMGVRIYVTVNTLVSDSLIQEFYNLIKALVDAKVDAFIVQDFGVVHLLRNYFKNIIIHASTQMGIHNLEGAKVAESVGIKRIVLSRETKLEDIKLIHENTNLEIEYFVQGALCVAFSGNCYLSAVENNMSGNEGKCKQLCRLPYYSNISEKTAYYLSARDLSLIESLPELIDAGVTSFKIEGRMRHPGYCAITTHIYKTAIDKIIDGTFTKEWAQSQNTILRETFSRGEFNKRAYLDPATPQNIINKDFQNHIGVEVGKVVSVKSFKDKLYKVIISSEAELGNNDGIKIIDTQNNEQVASLGLGNVKKIGSSQYEIITKYFFKPNLSVFLTQNFSAEEQVLNLRKKLPVSIVISALSGKCAEISAICGDCKVTLSSPYQLEKAKKIALEKQDFEEQFEKTGDFPFEVTSLSLTTDGIFLPKSMLNNLRRQTFEKLKEQLIKNAEKDNLAAALQIDAAVNSALRHKPQNIAITDIPVYRKEFENFDIIVFSPGDYNYDIIAEAKSAFGKKFALSLPTIAGSRDMKIIQSVLEKLGADTILFANNIYGLNFVDKYDLIVSPLLNIKNSLAIEFMLQLGARTICAGFEADEDFCTKNDLVRFVGGNFPLMTFAHCPYKTIYENSCANCKYQGDFMLQNTNSDSYIVTRKRISACYFHLNKYFLPKISKFCLFNFSKR